MDVQSRRRPGICASQMSTLNPDDSKSTIRTVNIVLIFVSISTALARSRWLQPEKSMNQTTA